MNTTEQFKALGIAAVEAGENATRGMLALQRAMQPKPSENPLRLRFRAPAYDYGKGDRVRCGIERALTEAHRRAVETGQRQVVTVSRYAVAWDGDTSMRIQAWR